MARTILLTRRSECTWRCPTATTLGERHSTPDAKDRRAHDRAARRVADVGGRVYPAKDAGMSATLFQRLVPQWRKLEAARDLCTAESYREGHHQRHRIEARRRLSSGLLALSHVDRCACARRYFQAIKVLTAFY